MSSARRKRARADDPQEDEREEEEEEKPPAAAAAAPLSTIEVIKRAAQEAQQKRLDDKVKQLQSGGGRSSLGGGAAATGTPPDGARASKRTRASSSSTPVAAAAAVSKRPIRNSLLSSAASAAAASTTPASKTGRISSASSALALSFNAALEGEEEEEEDDATLTKPHLLSPPQQPTRNISHNYDAFVLDCDGVLWHDDSPVPGAAEALLELRARNAKLHFMTNNSTYSRAALANKLQRLSSSSSPLVIDPMTEVTTSGSACAAAIRAQFPHATRAYVIGEQGLVDELALQQIHAVSSSDDSNEQPVDVVVCGLDRAFSYAKLEVASNHVQQCGALFVTNLDAYDMSSNGSGSRTVPGAGCMAAALLASLPTPPRTYFVCGKPNGEVLRYIMRLRGMHCESTIVVGDRVDTDVEFALNAGVSSCLVLTGVSKTFSPRASFVKRSLYDFVCGV